MTIKERTQNPTVGDELKLRLFIYKSNCRTDVSKVDKVEIFKLPDSDCSAGCDAGEKVLIETIYNQHVTHECTGEYSVTTTLNGVYTIGKYEDRWSLQIDDNVPCTTVSNLFQIMPSLWYTAPTPIIYDFQFAFRPNRLRQGSKQHLVVDIQPNVPQASDMERYYRNLSQYSCISIFIAKNCVTCPSDDGDLIVEDQPIIYREKGKGFYFLDTTDMDCGVYDVWFKMNFGENTYISDRQQLQIYN